MIIPHGYAKYVDASSAAFFAFLARRAIIVGKPSIDAVDALPKTMRYHRCTTLVVACLLSLAAGTLLAGRRAAAPPPAVLRLTPAAPGVPTQ